MWPMLTGGVNYSIPGNGGPDCLNYSTNFQRFSETLLISALSYAAVAYSFHNLQFPVTSDQKAMLAGEFSILRRTILLALCLIFGAQIGYKMASRSVIYLLNPCHVVTFMQICLLLCESSGKFSTWLFRLHLYTLSGATLALVFPIVNTLTLPGEIGLYYVQHSIILVVPFYLYTYGGSFSAERFSDFYWPTIIVAILFLYHFIFLQILSLVTLANLNNMLCPAISDPFHGQFYRLWAIGHQSLYVTIHGKFYRLLGNGFLRVFGMVPGLSLSKRASNDDQNGLDHKAQHCNGTVPKTFHTD